MEATNNKMVDLTAPEHYIQFSDGFRFPENWSMSFSSLDVMLNKPILTWDDGKHYATLFYREGRFISQNNENKGYFELQITSPVTFSIVTSRYILPIKTSTKYTLWITKKNNIYGLDYTEEVE